MLIAACSFSPLETNMENGKASSYLTAGGVRIHGAGDTVSVSMLISKLQESDTAALTEVGDQLTHTGSCSTCEVRVRAVQTASYVFFFSPIAAATRPVARQKDIHGRYTKGTVTA